MSTNSDNPNPPIPGAKPLTDAEISNIVKYGSADTPDSLQAELKKYQRSIREEWDQTEPKSSDDPSSLRRKAKTLFLSSLPDLAQEVLMLAQHADSEAVRLQAAKFAIDFIVSPGDKGAEDPLKDFLKTLTVDAKK